MLSDSSIKGGDYMETKAQKRSRVSTEGVMCALASY